MSAIALFLSLIALVVTKVADFVTTVRHVGPERETNPFARRCFDRFGFKGGLVAVAMVWAAIVGATYGYAWLAGGPLTQWATAIMGFGIAWAQWDAARFNRTGRTSWFTRQALTFYHRWTRRWRSR